MKNRHAFGFLIALLPFLAACNAFRQKVTVGPGTETFEDHTFEIVIMLLGAFALGLWLGWILWNRYQQMAETLRVENESLTSSFAAMKTENETLKGKYNAADSQVKYLESQHAQMLVEQEASNNSLAALQKDLAHERYRTNQLEAELSVALAKSPEAAAVPMEIETSDADVFVEDLAEPVLVEPELPTLKQEHEAEILDFEGIESFSEPEFGSIEEPVLEITNHQVVEETPIELGLSDDLVEPANEVELESTHVEETTEAVNEASHDLPEMETTAPALATQDLVAATDQKDDLKIVEGIGPKIEELLFQHHIYTFRQLSATPVNRIKEILTSAGSRYAMHDPGTWPAQPLLAANGEWENLKAYQGFLNAGKRPG